MPDGLVRIGDLAKQTPLKLAKKTASEYLDSCQPIEIPQRPPMLRHMNRARIDEQRSALKDQYDALVQMWNVWQQAYSSAILDNTNRLRGALWVYRELDSHPMDAEALELRDKVHAVLKEDWGVYDVPASRFDCDELARMTAVTMARVETRRPEDREKRAENSNA